LNPSDPLLRLVYASRNLIPAEETEAAVATILAASRRRNPTLGVTGALLFSADCFAQALEGPAEAVGDLFELIQIDPRHDRVVILESACVTRREFGDWSMAYAGRQDDPRLRFDAVRAAPRQAGGRVLDVLRGTVARSLPALA